MEPLAIGIDVGGTNVRGGVVDARGAILLRREAATPKEGSDALLSRMEGLARDLVTSADQPISAIGVGTGGCVELGSGRVVGATAVIPGWAGVSLQSYLSQRLKLPVSVDNDAKAALKGELTWGAAKGSRMVVFVTLGTGVGGALACNARIVHGAKGFAGHIGHIPVVPEGKSCSCGRRGCLEAYASGQAIAGEGRRQWAEVASPPEAASAAEAVANATAVWGAFRAGASWAQPVIAGALAALATALTGVIHMVNPDLVLIGGGLVAWGEAWRAAIEAAVTGGVMPPFREGLSVRLAALGPDAGLVGAAALGFEAAGVKL